MLQSKCSAKYLPGANCALTDLRNCMCTNDTLQYEIGACVLKNCNVTEQISMEADTFLCVKAKVNILVSSTLTQNEVCNGVPQPWQGDRAIRASIIVSAITFPIITLRFISRIYITRRVWWDDWAILVTTVSLAIIIIQSSNRQTECRLNNNFQIFMLPNTVIPIYCKQLSIGDHCTQNNLLSSIIPRIWKALLRRTAHGASTPSASRQPLPQHTFKSNSTSSFTSHRYFMS